MIVLVVLEAIAIAVLAVIVFGLLRTHAEILRALHRAGVPLEGEDETTPAPSLPTTPAGRGGVTEMPAGRGGVTDIVGTVPGGGPVQVSLAGGHHTLLAFLSSGCRTCGTFWDEFARTDLDLPGTATRLVIVAQDPEHESESRVAELAPAGVRTVCSSAAWDAYAVPGSPYFVLVDGAADAVVGSGTATSWSQVHGLLSRALGDETLAGRASVDDALLAAGIGPGHPSLHAGEDDDGERV